MKKSFLIMSSLFCLTSYLSAQGQVAQRLEEFWNGDDATWDLRQVDNYQYDDEGREILHTHEDTFEDFFEFPSYKKFFRETVYNDFGKILLQRFRSYNDTAYNENRTFHTFDNEQRLIEKLYEYESMISEEEYVFRSKNILTYDSDKHTLLNQTFAEREEDTWQLNSQRKEYFDENDCQLRDEQTSFFADGNVLGRNWYVYTRDEDCKPLTQFRLVKDDDVDTMFILEKLYYEYLNGGKTTRLTSEEFRESIEEWVTTSLREEEKDEEGRLIRQYSHYIYNQSDFKNLSIFTYNEQGEYSSRRTYNNYNSEDGTLQLNFRDTSIYEYNDLNQVLKKTSFFERYEGQSTPSFITKSTSVYEYYCNGQLKRETIETLPQITRITYQYEEKTPCMTDVIDPEITVFPNPAADKITISSDLLGDYDVVLRIFSINGQEVLTKQITQLTDQIQVEVSNWNRGSYVVYLTNGKENLTEKIFIL